MRHKILFTVALSAALVALTACSTGGGGTASPSASGGTSEKDLIAAATKEGQVVVYTGWRDNGIAAVTKGFEAKYPGIKVVISQRYSSAALGQKITADLRSSGKVNADFVLTTDQSITQTLADQNQSKKLSPDMFPGLDKKFVTTAAVACEVGVPVVGYNTSALPSGVTIDSWKSLLDAKLKGQIMIPDPRESAAWAGTWSIIYHDKTLGADYIKKIGQSGFQPVASSLVATEQLVAGQGAVMSFGIPSLFDPAAAKGQPIKYWYPESPAPTFEDFCALPANAEHPAAGELFIKWIMSPEGQAASSGSDGVASPLGKVPGVSVPLPADFQAPPAPAQVAEDLPKVLALLGFH